MTATIPGEQSLDQVAGAEDYYKTLTEGGLVELLVQCTKAVMAKGPALAAMATEPEVATVTPQSAPAPVSVPPAASHPLTASGPQSPAATVQQRASVWPWMVGLLALIAFAALVLKSRA